MIEEKGVFICNFPELLSEIGASTKFGQDELISMISLQDDDGKDFHIYHRQRHFCVPVDKIREFFVTHQKPVPPMSEREELLYLRKKVEELENQAKKATGKPLEKTDEKKVEDISDVEPFEATEKQIRPIPPQRDETIPPPKERKKMSLEEIQADLAKELKDAKNPKKKTIDSAVPKDIKGREEQVSNLLKNK